MADVPTKQFFGTKQANCVSTATDIAAGNFGATNTIYDNTSDAAIPYARYASATAVMPDWAAAPVAGTVVELWGVLQDVDSTTDDTDAPSGTASGGARYFGAFVIAAVDALQRRTIVIDMLGVKKVAFYTKNGTAQNMNNDAGTSHTVDVTPLALGVTV